MNNLKQFCNRLKDEPMAIVGIAFTIILALLTFEQMTGLSASIRSNSVYGPLPMPMHSSSAEVHHSAFEHSSAMHAASSRYSSAMHIVSPAEKRRLERLSRRKSR